MTLSDSTSPRWRLRLAAIFAAGLLLQLVMSVRSGFHGDQAHLLALGLRLVDGGPLEPWTRIMQGIGNHGALMQVLVGVPLAIVEDHRAPLIVNVLFHVVGFFLLASVMRRAVGDRTALVYLALLWLSPWRVYHSSFLWEPNYLLLPAAMHLAACWAARERATFGSSMMLAASVVIALQLHNSFLILALMTIALAVNRAIRLHWPGLVAGVVVAGLPLVLTVRAFLEGTVPPAGELDGFIGKGFVTVLPMLKGFIYWVRLGSLDVGVPLSQTVFIEEGIGRHGAWTVIAYALWAVGVVTIGIAIRASWWYLAPLWRQWRARRKQAGTGTLETPREQEPPRQEGWLWLRRYAVAALVAIVVSAGLSPITLQGWMVVIALHAAVLPVACWLDGSVPGSRRGLVLGATVAAQVALALVLALGNRIYRGVPIDDEHVRRYPQLERLIDR
jgi:hypothetical protein